MPRYSVLGIKPAMKTCAGTLGSVHYEGGKMLVLASPGVDTGVSMDGYKQKVVAGASGITSCTSFDGSEGACTNLGAGQLLRIILQRTVIAIQMPGERENGHGKGFTLPPQICKRKRRKCDHCII